MTAAKAKTVSFSPALWVWAAATELGEKIEGARDDQGARRACQRTRAEAGLVRVGDGFGTLEIRFGARGEVPCPQGARIRGFGRDEDRAEDREGPEDQLRPLVLEDRDEQDPVVTGRETRQEIADAGEVVRAVPDLER